MEQKALELWVRLSNEVSGPYYEDDYGRTWCLFCTTQNGDKGEHESDCIYVEAMKLVEAYKASQPQ